MREQPRSGIKSVPLKKKMEIKELINHHAKWLDGSGLFAHIVISSRIRLARNLNGISFPHRAKSADLERVFSLVEDALRRSGSLNDWWTLILNNLSSIERQFLLERHLISVEHAQKENKPRFVIANGDEVVSIMINEEDHLRIQVIYSGLELKRAWELISRIDSQLGEYLNYAFSEEFGYLTSCPTNTGTGMRASILVHLPALAKRGEINDLIKAISQMGLVVRGFYGEGTKSQASFFQISNQVTLGLTEEEIIDNIERISTQIVLQEEKARSRLLNENKKKIRDSVGRSYGALKNGHIVSSREAMNLLSEVRLGAGLKLVPEMELSLLNELLLLIGPAHLQLMEGRRLDALVRDVKRAELLRKKLNKNL